MENERIILIMLSCLLGWTIGGSLSPLVGILFDKISERIKAGRKKNEQ